MTQTLSMDKLYQKLSAVGLSASYVRRAGLPSWWSDELNDKPAAVLEGAGHISKRLNLDLESLIKDDQDIRFKPLPETNFKYHVQDQADIPSTSHQLASRVAELVACSLKQPFIPIPSSVTQVRTEILQRYPQITLAAILDYCWQHGIAVVYFNDYPDNTRKITGMVQWQGDRPVIVLSHKRTHPAWLGFHLAHELAHLALGHVQDGILIDDEIDQDSTDLEEMEANRFAVCLLVNQFDNCFKNKKLYNNEQLKQQLLEKLKSDPTVDACALALNYAWHTKNYGLANRAVQSLHCAEDGNIIINQFLEKHLDWDSLSDDNVDYLERILGE
ncbi:ImmA/IrrE family metallo-endopeptidase [Synechococcales cyanobacterium C]|uniref:ImmA/IrrE family metallo-endopeptidase n=1 Tax=Petrachloros mirabilis ULC683 TaxID=2781853 RepID=A0A8K1ZZM1_9CYAN|nr:ImmA/IrrE family metallo-endopeptidase [Petrachloros mirabilis]NCJ07047.1 ImmA/IrrE family metallo-endopeptidase [Petrachloros mirabilis ULC683]